MSLVQFLVQNEPSFRESRLPSLYSDLSNLRATNPEGFAANSHAWTSALTLLAVSGNLPTEQRIILSTSDSLLSVLSSPTYGRPVGLGAVLDDAVRDGKMIDMSDFASADKSIYARTWLPSPWVILKWSLRTAGVLGPGSYNKSGNLKAGNLVLVPVLEDITKKLLAWQQRQGQSPTDRIYTREAFGSVISELLSTAQHSTPLNAKDLEVLLLYLSRDNPILTYDDKTVKLKPLTSTRPEPITPEDSAVANLKSLISSLTLQTTALEASVNENQQRAASAVTAKNKTTALAALRSKKSAERALAQRTATLQQLEDVYTQIQQAADQVEVVATLKTSASALKTLNKKVGSVDSVDAVLDELREEMQKTGEVQQIISEPLGDAGAADVADAEVDDELEAMEREERQKEEELKVKETEARLKELEDLQQKQKQQEEERKAQEENTELEAQLAKSVEDMRSLDLDGRKIDERKQEMPKEAVQEAS
ncbi:uncharacterized protein HMPREF1541_09719 [Cyphellophora europaea CBS 101466]|uniref:SNF7 family protein n=1 Tax=Cyphellophora europaea (strain CBS 101466) TaxID=1220924 RepID=W2SAB5_CYPE1|nr:uncharacterized protein HMPREF1541_09719 [Cyphellophora europaea CBS 101466]ETN44844.1 hypothetical protein HMPREF1541_09719 [Cyphellophora europaea CBS 101466]